MRIKLFSSIAAISMIYFSAQLSIAQTANQGLAETVVESVTQAPSQAASPSLTPAHSGQVFSNSIGQPVTENYGYNTPSTGMPDYISQRAPSLIDLYSCGGRKPVKPPCRGIPSYGGDFCIGKAHGRPLIGRWCGF